MVARRTRLIEAPAHAVWAVVADPHHFPRWWPGVVRMEGVHDDRFTQVYTTKRGRAVRMDFRMIASDPPEDGGSARVSFAQEVAGTPFERVLNQSVTQVAMEPEDRGTRVTIAQQQKLRGYSRTGGWMLRRATGRRLQEALEGLERVCA
jgi:carbon monoxide dehydrogenase subunit G